MAISVDQLLTRAAAFERRGNLSSAAEAYRAVLARYPGNRRANQALAGVTAKVDAAMAGHVAMLLRLVRTGAANQAMELAENLRSSAPHTPQIDRALGEAFLALGRPNDAVEALTSAIANDPSDRDGQLALGAALFRAGRLDESIQALQALVAAAPKHGAAQFNLAVALRESGDLQAAISAVRAALAQLPDAPEVAMTLGDLLRQTGEPAAAEQAYRDGLARAADHPALIHNCAALLLEQGNVAEAAALFARLTDLAPIEQRAWVGLARSLARSLRDEPAASAYLRALELNPEDAALWHEYGQFLSEFGQVDAAREAHEKALALQPESGDSYEKIALLHGFSVGDPLIARMQELLARPEASETDRCGLHFGLAQAAAQTGEIARAFEHYAAANKLRRAAIGYTPEADATLFGNIEAAFATAPAPLTLSPSGPRPVFILGMPRSGTSLVEQILAAHPDVCAAGELAILNRAVLAEAPGILTAGEAPDPDSLAAIAGRYRNTAQRLAGGKPVLTDKMPLNFRWIGVILAALPEARILHLRRDPMAIGWSCFRSDFSGLGNGFAYDLDDIGRYLRLHDQLMAHWHGLYPGRIETVDYEALTADPEPGIRALVASAGLSWDPACLESHTLSRRVATVSAQQVRKPIYRGASDDWRAYAAQLEPLAAALR